jgi:Na+-transporting methylmalonyl-CoA/oxaloacetate decarboxylase gamma subunit
VVLASFLVLLLLAAGVWYLSRPKPQVVVPPEVRARDALKPLESRPESGELLSRVSQVVRAYVTAAFGLPPGERTTTEFNQAIAGQEALGPDLPSAVGDFLRRCDERKFSPTPPPTPLSAVAEARQLIDRAEARLAEVREQARKAADSPQP